MPLTHVYAHLLADVVFGGYAPAFAFAVIRQLCSPQTAGLHSLGRYVAL